jgi:hypothetical protein
VRDGLLRIQQATRDHLAHGIVRDLLVGARLEELLDLLVAHRGRSRGLRRAGCRRCGGSGGSRWCRGRRGLRGAALQGLPHVAFHDATVGAGALNPREVEPRFLGEALRQGRGEDASSALPCSVRLRSRGAVMRGFRGSLGRRIDAGVGNVTGIAAAVAVLA